MHDHSDKIKASSANERQTGSFWKQFFFPSLNRKTFVRICLTGIFAYIIFSYICIPLKIHGVSMEPTYKNGGINFCWRPAFWFSEPKPFDIVIVRMAGKRIMLMKRVVALAGDIVAFHNGKLHVNGKPVDEPYVQYPCNWELPAREVAPNHVYVVGDNRSVPMEIHDFGQTSINRIMGAALW